MLRLCWHFQHHVFGHHHWRSNSSPYTATHEERTSYAEGRMAGPYLAMPGQAGAELAAGAVLPVAWLDQSAAALKIPVHHLF